MVRALGVAASLWACLLGAVVAEAQAADGATLFDAPALGGVRVDGETQDWQGGGLEVGILPDVDGGMPPAEDVDARFRLAWDERGLLLALTVTDDGAHENADAGSLWSMDSVELFVADRQGSAGFYQVALAPGLDPAHPELRRFFYDQRAARTTRLDLETARMRTASGYVLECRLPWQNLGLSPHQGLEVGFQVYVNDTDGGTGYPNG
ncbi:MAG: sugar-binding protein [Candidatus Latescibacterota bacterium]